MVARHSHKFFAGVARAAALGMRVWRKPARETFKASWREADFAVGPYRAFDAHSVARALSPNQWCVMATGRRIQRNGDDRRRTENGGVLEARRMWYIGEITSTRDGGI